MIVDELERLFEVKRLKMCNRVLAVDTVMTSNGFLDTAKGPVLASARALKLAPEKDNDDRRRRIEKELQVSALEERAARRTAIAQGAENGFLETSYQRRADLSGVVER